jgi:hypothetical protein
VAGWIALIAGALNHAQAHLMEITPENEKKELCTEMAGRARIATAPPARPASRQYRASDVVSAAQLRHAVVATLHLPMNLVGIQLCTSERASLGGAIR